MTDKSPVEVVQATGERVRKTAGTILDALPTVQVGAGDPPGLSRDPVSVEGAARPERISAPPAGLPRRRVQRTSR